jgi:hypothetical protein
MIVFKLATSHLHVLETQTFWSPVARSKVTCTLNISLAMISQKKQQISMKILKRVLPIQNKNQMHLINWKPKDHVILLKQTQQSNAGIANNLVTSRKNATMQEVRLLVFSAANIIMNRLNATKNFALNAIRSDIKLQIAS